MRRLRVHAIAVCLASALSLGVTRQAAAAPDHAPVAPVETVTDSYFGVSVADPYRWMENDKDPRFAEFMKAEGAYTAQVMSSIPGRDALAERVRSLLNAGTAVFKVTLAGPEVFYFKQAPGDQTPRLYTRHGIHGAERLLADVNADPSGPHRNIDWFAPSWDGKLLAYGVSTGGSEDSVLYVVRTADAKIQSEAIEGARFGVTTWMPDNRTFYYLRLQPMAADAAPSAKYQKVKLYRHVVGVSPRGQDDVPVVGYQLGNNVEVGLTELPQLEYSPASDYLMLTVQQFVKREFDVYVVARKDFKGADSHWVKVASEDDDVIRADIHDKTLYLLSHKDASRFKVLAVQMDHPDMAHAKEIVAPSQAVLTDLQIARDALYVQQLDGGIGKMLRVDYKSGSSQQLPLPFKGAISEVAFDPEQPGALLKLTGWTEPQLWYQYDPKSAKLTDTKLRARSPVDFSAITSDEVMATAADGTKIPLSIIHRKDMQFNGSNRTILEGYGAYGVTLDPAFDPSKLAWLERGNVYAVAHLRGGGEFGEDWHLAGQKLTKTNTITDMIACAQYLIDQKITSPQNLAAMGGSAGGIPAGGVLTQRPDLFAVILDDVGMSDAVRVETSPNGPTNTPEFGSTKTEDGFKGLYAMSAYHHVKDHTAYPAVMFVTGINDPRVAPWQMAKMTARVQAATSSGNPVLLRVDYDAGHGIGSTKDQFAATWADQMSFVLWQTGDPAFQPKP
jgi:prolyl oligopeptidase